MLTFVYINIKSMQFLYTFYLYIYRGIKGEIMYFQSMSMLATNPFCGFSTGFFNPLGGFCGFMNQIQFPFVPMMSIFQAFQNPYNFNNTNTSFLPFFTQFMPVNTPVIPAPVVPNLNIPSANSVTHLPFNTQNNSSVRTISSNSQDLNEEVSDNYSSNTITKIKNSSLMKNVSPDLKAQILSAVDRACKKYNVDPKLVISIMYVESRFNPRATGAYINKIHDRAKGLMQLIPSTAKHYGANNVYDIEENIFAGVKFISELTKRYKGNRTLIAAAYNAGPVNVKNSVPNFKETKHYVVDVNRAYTSLG